jgi:hypothetical protein
MTFGDPRYMSPEQARGDRIDRRADIYQLGCVAYEMLTGAPPFTGSRVFDILTKQVTEAPAPLPSRRPGVPLWMEAACAKMLAKDPENRFATTTRMVEALRRGLDTGEVMDDEVARRRESIPPPSVSRAMKRMGIEPTPAPLPTTAPAPTPAPTPAPAAPAFAPAETVRGVAPAAKPDSVELLRKRTGTPQLGVPVLPSAPVVAAEQPPVAGVISVESSRMPRASTDERALSGVWYEDEHDASRTTRSDSLFDTEPPQRRRPIIIAVAAVALVACGIAFAITRGGSDGKDDRVNKLAIQPPPQIAIDAPPAELVTEPADAAIATSPPGDAAAVGRRVPRVDKSVDTTDFTPLGSDPDRRPPPPPPPLVITPPKVQIDAGTSVTSNPEDPYGSGSGSAVQPTEDNRKAEFYANLGTQQLGANDLTAAASSFKRALEIEPNNAIATIGMGEIASRQGLFGDAIAHLRKAARLAPRSARVYVLLGDAYLHSGNHKEAAANFKKALQLDPDNARARNGYNEAAGRLPPPTDDP